MTRGPRWERCITHRNGDAEAFIAQYFPDRSTSCALIAGAGFDPRSKLVAERLHKTAGPQVRAFLLREERPNPDPLLMKAGDESAGVITSYFPRSSEVHSVNILDEEDNAPFGGRRVINKLKDFSLDGVTDLVVDASALSVGICFSIVKYCYEIACQRNINLHLMVVDRPDTDVAIQTTYCEMESSPHGFQGEWKLHTAETAAKLWMPQLAHNKTGLLNRLHQHISPHAVCPILPFPATNPRSPDELMNEYHQYLGPTWKVDARDLIYACEKSPVDLYRTILRIDDSRKRVFEEMGGSQIILSPVGSKALALGALMAALERDFAVVLVEALEYKVTGETLGNREAANGELIHIWLHGDVYPNDVSK